MLPAEAKTNSLTSQPESTPATSISRLYSKADIGRAKGVTPRTIDNWIARGLLPAPMKFGTTVQARVRWTDEDIAALDRKLASLRRPSPSALIGQQL